MKANSAGNDRLLLDDCISVCFFLFGIDQTISEARSCAELITDCLDSGTVHFKVLELLRNQANCSNFIIR